MCSALSDFSDYDSSDPEYQSAVRSRRQSMAAPKAASSSKRDSKHQAYSTLEDDGAQGKRGLLDSSDPFGDPDDTPIGERPMQCTSREHGVCLS